MNEFFKMKITEVGDMTGTQIAGLISGKHTLDMRIKEGAKYGATLPHGTYKKIAAK
jgi:hypothetical protein